MASKKKNVISVIFSPVTSIAKYFYLGITAPFTIFNKKSKKQIADEKIYKIDQKIDEMIDEKEKIKQDLINDKERKMQINEHPKSLEPTIGSGISSTSTNVSIENDKISKQNNVNNGMEKKEKKKKKKEKKIKERKKDKIKEIEKEFNELSGDDILKKQGIASFINNNKAKNDIPKEEKKLELESSKKSKEELGNKQTFIYDAKSPEGKPIKGKFDAYTKADVIAFLTNEGYEVYNVKTSKMINFLYGSSSLNQAKYSKKQLTFFLTQLSTYIKAGIPLIDSIRIFAKQEKNVGKKKILQSIVYELVMGESFSSALEKQRSSFPALLINMIKTAEMTGELAETLDDMGNYYASLEKTRKQIVSAMTYPAIVFVMCIGIVTFIMIYVVPQFVDMYADLGSELPGITKVTIAISDFMTNYWYIVFGGLFIFIILFVYCFKNVKPFRKAVQTVMMKIPVVGNIIKYAEIQTFSKTFASLINHNVFITDSMEILSKITSNEIYKGLIYNTIDNLSKGDTISKAFQNHWAFTDIAYEMIVTGERTGELGSMMERVANFYGEQHENIVGQLKSFIEPVMIAFLAVIVGGLLLAIMVPMFGMYSQIG